MRKSVKFKYDLGIRLKDVTCGYEGIVTERSQCLNGCLRYTLTPKIKKDGERGEAWCIDEGQLVEVDRGIHAKVETKPPKRATGGPSIRASANVA